MATAETFIEELKTLVTRNMEANTQLAARVSALVQQASKGGLPSNANELFSRWLDFNLTSATLLSSHSLEVMQGMVSAAERSLVGGVADTPPPIVESPPRHDAPIDLHTRGVPGETVRAPFLIANEYDRPLEVSFEASALGSASGDVIPAEQVAFEPAALTLHRGQQVVQAAITISPKAHPGETYRGEIRIKGYQARTIILAVTVLEGHAGESPDEKAEKSHHAAASGAASSTSRGTKKRRSSKPAT